MRVLVDPTPPAAHRLRQTDQVFQWMKLSLPGEAKALARIEVWQWSARHKMHIMKARVVSGLQFLLQKPCSFLRRREQKTVEPFKVAGNVFLLRDGFNAGNGHGVAIGGQARPLVTVVALQLGV